MALYILDLIGTAAFAVYGSYVGIRKKLDLFGVFVCAFLTGLGGGTVRELLLGNTPFYFYDMNYIYVVLGAILFTLLVYKYFAKVNKYMLVVDAIGLSTFAFIGATKAAEAHLNWFGVVALATLTAAGGSLLRDIAINEIPEILKRNFYAVAAAVLGVLYVVCESYMADPLAGYFLMLFVFLLRLYAIHFKIHLWIPYKRVR